VPRAHVAEVISVKVSLAQDNDATGQARTHSEKNWETMLNALKKFLEQ
jgi:hypothetical protein